MVVFKEYSFGGCVGFEMFLFLFRVGERVLFFLMLL